MIPFPRNVLSLHQIEVTSACDLRCVFCPSKDIVDGVYAEKDADGKIVGGRRGEHMSRKNYLRALEWTAWSVANGKDEINLAGTGETTIHPDFLEYMRLARECVGPRVRLFLTTNGISMTLEKAKVLKELNVAVWVSLHQPARASMGIQHLKDAGFSMGGKLLPGWEEQQGGVSCDEVMGPMNWAGQVRFAPAEKARATNQGAQCPWMSEQRIMVMSDGRITTCSLDASGGGVIGHVDDVPGSLQIRPYELCKTCHQRIDASTPSGWNQKEGKAL